MPGKAGALDQALELARIGQHLAHQIVGATGIARRARDLRRCWQAVFAVQAVKHQRIKPVSAQGGEQLPSVLADAGQRGEQGHAVYKQFHG